LFTIDHEIVGSLIYNLIMNGLGMELIINDLKIIRLNSPKLTQNNDGELDSLDSKINSFNCHFVTTFSKPHFSSNDLVQNKSLSLKYFCIDLSIHFRALVIKLYALGKTRFGF